MSQKLMSILNLLILSFLMPFSCGNKKENSERNHFPQGTENEPPVANPKQFQLDFNNLTLPESRQILDADLNEGFLDKLTIDQNGILQLQGGQWAYNQDSTPTFSHWLQSDIRHRNAMTYSQDSGFLYLSTFNGLYAFDTKKTLDQKDDELIGLYNSTTTPAIYDDKVIGSTYDPTSGFLYTYYYAGWATLNGTSYIDVIDTKKTKDLSDDLNIFRYTLASGIVSVYVSTTLDCLYVATQYQGVTVINKNGTTDPSDDVWGTPGYIYTSASSPAIVHTYSDSVYLDEVSKILYISTWNGVSVLDTQGTVITTDDVLIGTYNNAFLNGLDSYLLGKIFYDPTSHLLFISKIWTESGEDRLVYLFDTKGTVTMNDDVLLKTYSKNSLPASKGMINDYSYDTNLGLIYFATSAGLVIVDTKKNSEPADDTYTLPENSLHILHLAIAQDPEIFFFGLSSGKVLALFDKNKYFFSGTHTSLPLELSKLPSSKIHLIGNSLDSTLVKMHYRSTESQIVWKESMDSGSGFQIENDYPSSKFQTIVFENGAIRLSNPTDTWAQFSLNTTKPSSYFPAGSLVKMKIRFNSSNPDRLVTTAISVDPTDGYFHFYPEANQWIYTQFIADDAFHRIHFEQSFDDSDPWQAEDSFEIDWISIEPPDTEWTNWSEACSSLVPCTIADSELSGKKWLQTRLELATNDVNSTPTIESLTYKSGFDAAGDYLSKVLDAEGVVKWGELTADTSIPEHTKIQFFSRSGNSESPDDSWSTWEQVAKIPGKVLSPPGQYIQVKASLSTEDSHATPILKSVSVGSE